MGKALATHYIELKARLDSFEGGMKKVTRSLANVGKKVDTTQKQFAGKLQPAMNKVQASSVNLSAAFSGIAKRLAAIGLAYFGMRGIGRLARSFMDVASSTEQYQLRLEVLLGSQKAANDAMKFFQKIASEIPFTLQEVIESSTTLVAMGADYKKWTGVLTDLAAVMGMRLPEAASALGRAFAGGAGAADIFRERGILQIIKDSARLKSGIGDITKLTLPEFRDAMYAAFTDPSGKISGASDKLKESWKGMISMLEDSWYQLRRKIMDAGLFKMMKEKLQEVIDWIDKFKAEGGFEEIALQMSAAADLTGKATNAVVKDLKRQKAIFDLITGTITDAVFSVKGYAESMERLKEIEKEYAARGRDTIKTLKEEKEAIGDVTTLIETQIDKLPGIIVGYDSWGYKMVGLRDIMDGLKTKIEEVSETLIQTALPAVESMAPVLEAAGVKFGEMGTAIATLGEQMTWAFQDAVYGALDAFQRLGEESGSVLETLGTAIHGFVTSAISALKRWTAETLAAAAQTVIAKEMEAVAGVIASVMKSLGFPLNLMAVGAAIAATSALFSGLTPKTKKYEAGGFVPQETFAHLHPGEYVLPKQEAWKGLGTAGSKAEVNVNLGGVHINAIDALGVRDFMRERGLPEIVEAVKAGIQQPELRKALGVEK
ncbi:MAG: hypothetical protein HQ555_07790 [Candidatus Aminicenantes bacterium]|nr:hypothetical protein [Candidatus Aminicenantes bacterium]